MDLTLQADFTVLVHVIERSGLCTRVEVSRIHMGVGEHPLYMYMWTASSEAVFDRRLFPCVLTTNKSTCMSMNLQASGLSTAAPIHEPPGSNPELVERDSNADESRAVGQQDGPVDAAAGSPSPTPREATLDEAILDGGHDRIRRLLIEICASIPDARELASSSLLAPIPSTSANRKRNAFETCCNCGVEYSITSNVLRDSVYHEGSSSSPLACPQMLTFRIDDKEVDWDSSVWDDHEDEIHGDRYSSELMDDPIYRDGYQWLLCDKPMSDKGCHVSKHKPLIRPRDAKRSMH